MEIRQLKSLAKQRVSACRYDARKLALIFTGAGVALSLLMTLVNFFLSQQIEGTGGLGGIGTRTLLSSIQMLVMLGGALAMPFWSLGYTRAALDTGRDGSAEPRTLLKGFRLFFPALRLFFLQGALLAIIIIASMQLGSILYMLTPVSEAAIPVIESLLSEGAGRSLCHKSAVKRVLAYVPAHRHYFVGAFDPRFVPAASGGIFSCRRRGKSAEKHDHQQFAHERSLPVDVQAGCELLVVFSAARLGSNAGIRR